MSRERVNNVTLLALVAVISGLFLWMIRRFLITLLLAGIFSALAHPMYRRFRERFGWKPATSSVVTLLIIVVMIVIPMLSLVSIVAAQGLEVGRNVTPWVREHLSQPDAVDRLLERIPYYQRIEPFQDEIFAKAGELAGILSRFLIDRLSAATLGTANFVLHLFLMLYSMFFFLIDGDKIVHKILYYLPLEDEDERLMLNRFTSVTVATLRGTALIGLLQGSLAGLGFFVVGIPSAVFWGAVMTVLSIIPAIGSSLVWIPAMVFLFVIGRPVAAIGLLVYCGALVGSLDNVLRPKLVGTETKMHELMILFGTLGGIVLFGVVGIFIGPIIAALFITVWDLYGVAFKEYLPAVFKDGPLLEHPSVCSEELEQPIDDEPDPGGPDTESPDG